MTARHLTALAALAATLAATPAVSASLKSMTDRSHLFGWEAVGRIDGSDNGGHCTGVLISPDLVLTAAHCLFERNSNTRRDPTELSFRAGFRDGETIATAQVARAVVPQDFDNTETDFLRFLRQDIALLELDEPIPSTTASPYAVTGPGAAGTRVTVVSYGRSRMNAASRESGCQVTAEGRGAMVFDCAGEPGSSGAPIFDTSGFAPRIMSLISSGGDYDGQDSVFGASLPEVVGDLKRALRSGRGVWPAKGAPEARRVAGANGPTPQVSTSGTRTVGGARFVKP